LLQRFRFAEKVEKHWFSVSSSTFKWQSVTSLCDTVPRIVILVAGHFRILVLGYFGKRLIKKKTVNHFLKQFVFIIFRIVCVIKPLKHFYLIYCEHVEAIERFLFDAYLPVPVSFLCEYFLVLPKL